VSLVEQRKAKAGTAYWNILSINPEISLRIEFFLINDLLSNLTQLYDFKNVIEINFNKNYRFNKK